MKELVQACENVEKKDILTKLLPTKFIMRLPGIDEA